MSILLQQLHLAPTGEGSSPIGLVAVWDEKALVTLSVAERVAVEQARLLSQDKQAAPIDYIFFRQFGDGRSPRAAAYVVDDSKNRHSDEALARLHQRVWINGSVPLLYVGRQTRVDILRCASKADFWDKNTENIIYHPHESIKALADLGGILQQDKANKFSAFRLATGAFWEDPANQHWASMKEASHQSLIKAVKEADQGLQKLTPSPVLRRLLLLFVFTKYLEDRKVFPPNWFSKYNKQANGFLDVIKAKNPKAVLDMIEALRVKFNGDIFAMPSETDSVPISDHLERFAELLEAKTIAKQRYLWEQFTFGYLPVEVLSHLYQHFAQKEDGAIYTPPFVADLILDELLPYDELTGYETILDPTCGSGVFLTGAFLRLINYWRSQNSWEPIGVPKLHEILCHSIYGVELHEEAIHIAALNLALAVCETLQPDVIWKELQFDPLLGRNLFQGDFFERLEDLRNAVPEGFDRIVGNPPFKSKLTKAALTTRNVPAETPAIPDKNIAYRILEECPNLLNQKGKMGLIQPSGILYNRNPQKFFQNFLNRYTLHAVLDFVSIRNLFESADTKALVLILSKQTASDHHQVQHLTFRKTLSVDKGLGFELSHYDWHHFPQQIAVEFPGIWKANLVGGGRLPDLINRISKWRTLQEFIKEMGWSSGEGYAVGKKYHEAKWLSELPEITPNQLNLTTESLNHETIYNKVGKSYFEAPRTPERYRAPMFLIREVPDLHTRMCPHGQFAYHNQIIGINVRQRDLQKLISFSIQFEKRRKLYKSLCLATSTRALVGRNTAILKNDIDELPWPEGDELETLSEWEHLLLDDVTNCYDPLIRLGHQAAVYHNTTTSEVIAHYADTFIKLLGSVYRKLRSGAWGTGHGMIWHSFIFGKECSSDLLDEWHSNEDSWLKHLEKLVYHKAGPTLRTNRILRIYDGNTLIIIKPDNVRHWIPSTAIRDADETLAELVDQGF